MENDLKLALEEAATLREAFRNVDDADWEFIFTALGKHRGGRSRFWIAVLAEVRAAISASQLAPASQGVDMVLVPRITKILDGAFSEPTSYCAAIAEMIAETIAAHQPASTPK